MERRTWRNVDGFSKCADATLFDDDVNRKISNFSVLKALFDSSK